MPSNAFGSIEGTAAGSSSVGHGRENEPNSSARAFRAEASAADEQAARCLPARP